MGGGGHRASQPVPSPTVYPLCTLSIHIPLLGLKLPKDRNNMLLHNYLPHNHNVPEKGDPKPPQSLSTCVDLTSVRQLPVLHFRHARTLPCLREVRPNHGASSS